MAGGAWRAGSCYTGCRTLVLQKGRVLEMGGSMVVQKCVGVLHTIELYPYRMVSCIIVPQADCEERNCKVPLHRSSLLSGPVKNMKPLSLGSECHQMVAALPALLVSQKPCHRIPPRQASRSTLLTRV